VNRITFIVALGAMIFIGWLYLGEMDTVRSTKADVVAAADNTAVALSQSANPERNTDTDAEDISKTGSDAVRAGRPDRKTKRRVDFNGSPSAIGQGVGARADYAE